MADEKPPKKPGREIDEAVTSSFPADGLRRELADLTVEGSDGGEKSAVENPDDPDSWVDQWSRLFADDAPADDAPADDATADDAPASEKPTPGKPPSKKPPSSKPATRKPATSKPAFKKPSTPHEPPTREMPVYSAEQPPIDRPATSRDRIPGHPDPQAAAKKKQDKSESDAAEILAWQKAQERTKRRAKLRSNQRKAQIIQRQRPAEPAVQLEDPSPQGRQEYEQPRSQRRTPPPSPSTDRSRSHERSIARPNRDVATERGGVPRSVLAAGGATLFVGALLVGYLLTGFGTRGDDADDVAATDVVAGAEASSQDFEVGADVTPRGISELALSTVQLVGLNDDLQPECAGSGVIVKSDGTILTNAHVVTSEGGCQFTSIGVGVTIDSTSPAELLYRADVLAVDGTLDLAVLRISGMLRPDVDGALPNSFPQAPLGDSDTVKLGDNVRILGYPVIGGDTITLTTGTVSGFTSQADIGTRALIKTDATISAGNSGGLAVDPDGRVIGIPTKARASESGPAIDCRALNDTNSDGAVDDQDNCVPVGGFLNGVRPINLALPLLDEAASADPLGAVVTVEEQETDFDFERVVVSNPRFSLGQQNNLPVDEVVTAQAGISELCFFVDWTGIPVGTTWDGAWFVDGALEPELGFTDQLWTIEEEGRNFWLCAREQNALGLPAGVYEIGFFLQGTLLFAEGIELTSEPVDVVPVTWTNDTDGDICELSVNPFSSSGQVGLNELEDGVTIPPGGSRPIDLPQGRVIVEAYNCDGEPVADAFAGLEIEGPATFLIGL